MKLKYPIAAANGSLVLTTDYPGRVKEAVISGLMTIVDERVMRPDFGRSYEPFDAYRLPDLLRDCRGAVTRSLADYPEVSFRLTATPDDGAVLVTCYYQAPDLDPGEVSTTIEV